MPKRSYAPARQGRSRQDPIIQAELLAMARQYEELAESMNRPDHTISGHLSGRLASRRHSRGQTANLLLRP
jgi:hypothetical protein